MQCNVGGGFKSQVKSRNIIVARRGRRKGKRKMMMMLFRWLLLQLVLFLISCSLPLWDIRIVGYRRMGWYGYDSSSSSSSSVKQARRVEIRTMHHRYPDRTVICPVRRLSFGI